MPNSLAFTPPPAPANLPQQSPQGLATSPAANPAPTHAQAVAALRHFQAVGRALYSLLKNPDLGKSSIKSAMIDATTKLVADRMIPSQQAVTLLGQLPDTPFQQKQWLEQLMKSNMTAQVAVLNNHRANNSGSGDFATESAQHVDNADDHMDVMQGMMQNHYGAR
jgi:hypothetical protein